MAEFPGVAAAAEDGRPDAADVGRLAARVVRAAGRPVAGNPVDWLLASTDSRHA